MYVLKKIHVGEGRGKKNVEKNLCWVEGSNFFGEEVKKFCEQKFILEKEKFRVNSTF